MVPQINIPTLLCICICSYPLSLSPTPTILLCVLMMSGSTGSSRFPFTASQWQELEHQALVFKYMVSGMPIPPDLLFTIRTSLDSSLSSKFLFHQPQHLGWNIGFGRKIDPEPGRCRRTDGKKWRCSKEAYPDSKYCERHMHRGRNRSRKPVEILSPTTAAPPPRNVHPSSSASAAAAPSDSQFLYPYFSSSRTPAFALSSQESTNFFLHSRSPSKDCRSCIYGHGIKGEGEERAFLSADSNSYSSYKLESESQMKLQSLKDEQPKKVTHHFLEEWAPKETNNTEERMPSHRTQLSISIPNSLHDFFNE